MGSKRKYLPIGMEPAYDDLFDRLRVHSVILNKNVRARDLRYGMMALNDVYVLKSLLLEWYGGDGGEYLKGDNTVIARIPECEQALKNNAEKFEVYKQQRINSGHNVPEETIELHTERVKLEAMMDVLREEVQEIEKWLEKAREPIKAQENLMMLKYGPAGRGSLRDGVVNVLDGQHCGQTAKGLLVIDDTRSPYHGMLVADYREQVVKAWSMARNRLNRERDKITKGAHIRYQSDEVKAAWQEREAELMVENPGWKALFSLKLDGKPLMPEWPKGIKNHLNGQAKK